MERGHYVLLCEPFFSGVTASNECEGGASELLEMRRPAWYLYSSNPIIIIEVNERLSSNQSEAECRYFYNLER